MEFTLDKLAKDVAEKALNEITYEGKTLREWVEIIVKQQACEDCISREQTLKAFAEKCGGECACCEYNGSGYDNAENCKLIKSMPCAIPQQKIGQWKYTTHHGCRYRVCTECKCEREDDLSTGWNYCPNCGADMTESEEEE